MNLILEHTTQVRYFTEINSVFQALRISASDFDWYLSDLEMIGSISGFEATDQWIGGEDLQRVITENEIQFIWGVLSAFPKGFRCEIEEPPYADGNPTYWEDSECKPQLTSALFEIVSWDSSAVILVGISAQAGDNFLQAYPDAKLLGE
jgi:hypothetical protein